jgi:hypothetical protein
MNPLKAVRRGITDGADAPKWFRERLRQDRLAAEPGMSAKDAKAVLTQPEIHAAEKFLEHTLRPRGLPIYTWEERFALAILAANYSLQQRVRGKKSIGAAKAAAEYRRNHVNLLLRYVVDKRYRKNPNTTATVMKIVEWLDEIGIEASESQVRRDIHAALKLGPLPTW